MTNLFLSPHPDDAVMSCGGLIYKLTQSGEAVTVFTVMAGDLPPDIQISSFIEEHLIRWGLGSNPVPGRKTEDTHAVESLGARVHFGRFPDLLYRTNGHGVTLYPDLETMFGEIDPRDPVLGHIHEITEALSKGMTIYAPMGAGGHVDHQLVRNAVVSWRQRNPEVAVFFYEEYPYSADGADIVWSARATLNIATTPVIHRLSGAALDAKINAIMFYESQISTFWDDASTMDAAVRQYATQVGAGIYAERLWQPV